MALLRPRRSSLMKPDGVREMAHINFPAFLRQREQAIVLDKWFRGRQFDVDGPYAPREVTDEYTDLAGRSSTGFAGLIVASLAQTMYVDGVRRPKQTSNMEVYNTWQENRWDSRQTAIHRAAIAHGLAFGVGMPGISPLTGNKTVLMRGVSAKRMAAFYDEHEDEWPRIAIEADPIPGELTDTPGGWTVRIYDEYAVHNLSCKDNGAELSDWTYISHEPHGAGVPPVVRYAKELDLDGRAVGAIEPHIPLLRRIDQGTFDRLIVQRFGAWKIRYVTGLAKPDNPDQQYAQALRLKIEDLLVSTSDKTKFGTLDATDVEGFIKSGDADLRYLSAVSQIPPHHLLGLSSNLQAEALAAAEGGLQRQSADVKMSFGESHEQFFRLIAHLTGNAEEARAFDMQVRWRDTESRSLAQAAAALGQLATQLKVPLEMLWERIPGWTDADSERAKKLVEDGSIDQLILRLEQELGGGNQGAPAGAPGAAQAGRGVESTS